MECGHKYTMCRLCLCESECFIDIFQVNEWFGYVAAEVIGDLLQFQVSETDGYPQVVCSICLGKLTDFKQFKEQCQNSRDTYNKVFAADENHSEHPVDIADLDPADSEEEETITDDIFPQVVLRPVKLEPKDPLDIQETQEEIRKCSVASTSLECLASRQKRNRRVSYGPYESSVSVHGKPSLKRRKKKAVDSNPGEIYLGKCGNLLAPLERLEDHRERAGSGSCKPDDAKISEEEEDAPGGGGTPKLKAERDRETVGGREGGEDARLGVKRGKREYYRCNDCGKGFKEKDVLIRHLGAHGFMGNGEVVGGEAERQVNTDVNRGTKGNTGKIRKGFERKTSDKVKRHEEVCKYVCDLCGKGFRRLGHLNGHLRVHSGERPFACATCGKRFGDRSNLKSHALTHAGAKPHACEVCGMRFARNSNLVPHRRIHGGEKPFGCETCGRRFTKGGILARHARTHRGEEPHARGTRSARERDLASRGRVREEAKPHACETCGKRFGRREHLKSHARVHSGEKPYSCRECGKCFSVGSSLRRHLRVHSQEKPYSCDVCQKRFSDNSNLRSHLTIHLQKKPC